MKKKLIAIIMALALVLTLTPMVYALADSGGTGGDGGAGDGTPNLTTQAVATDQAVIQVGSATVGTQGTMGATGTVNVKVVMPENESLNGVGSFTVKLDFDKENLQVVSEGTEIPEIDIGETESKPVTTNLADGDSGELDVTAANADGNVTSNLGSPDSKGETADSNKENRLQLSGATVLDVTFKAKDGVVDDELTFTLTECQVTKHVDSVEGSTETGGSTTYLMQLGDNGEHPATLYKAIATNTVKVVAGFSVSGSVTSWNDNNDVVLRLYNNTVSDTDIKADIKKDSPEKALSYGATKGGSITQNSTNTKQYDQTYSFDGIPVGEYKLVTYKPGGYVTHIESLSVNNADLSKNIKLGLQGDVNEDGSINATDMQRIYTHMNGTNPLSNLSLGDVNGDGSVNATDMQRVYTHMNDTNPFS